MGGVVSTAPRLVTCTTLEFQMNMYRENEHAWRKIYFEIKVRSF